MPVFLLWLCLFFSPITNAFSLQSMPWLHQIVLLLLQPMTIFILGFSLIFYRKKMARYHRQLQKTKTELDNTQMKLQQMSQSDALTGAKTRSQFLITLHEKRFSPTPYMITVLTIQNLRKVNKSYGLDIGDMVIKHVATQLRTHLHKVDFARLSGGEFAILFEDKDLSKVEVLLSRIQKKLQINPLHVDQIDIPIPIGIGSASYPQDHNEGEALLRLAISRMYAARSHFEDKEEAVMSPFI